jgi:hypothetical protein
VSNPEEKPNLIGESSTGVFHYTADGKQVMEVQLPGKYWTERFYTKLERDLG